MFNRTRHLGLALAIATAMSLPAAAQDTTTEQPADPLAPSLGQEVVEPYVKSTHGDWQLRCIRAQDGSDPCELYQLLKDGKGNSVSEITLVALPGGKDAVAGATIIVPLETLLTQQLTLAVDGGKPKRYAFTFCANVGCFARIGFTAEEIENMKKGSAAQISVVPVLAPDQVVSVSISLKGFTEAFEAVSAEAPKP